MKLITKAIEKAFQKQGYTGDKSLSEIKVICKIFNPSGVGTWYLYEHVEDDLYMAFVNLGDPEMAECGYVSLKELDSIRVKPFNLSLERDRHFGDYTVQEVIDKVKSYQHV